MKITVLAGSPKGETSITMQYVYYLKQQLDGHEVKIVQVSQPIGKIERHSEAFEEIISEVRSSDALLWAFPVYFLLVPSQYKRFIELIWERGAQDAFRGKYAAVLSTSIHFFDHTAHEYMRAVCDDLEMPFAGALSAEMYDLLREQRRDGLRAFAAGLVETHQRQLPASRRFSPLVPVALNYQPGPVKEPVDQGDKKVVILHDGTDEQPNLRGMIRRMRDSFAGEVDLINLHEVEIEAGCQGCLRCGQAYQCFFTGKDGFIDFYNQRLKPADILILAGHVVDRHLSSRWRMFGYPYGFSAQSAWRRDIWPEPSAWEALSACLP